MSYLDVAECGVLAVRQGLDHHERLKETALLDLVQHLLDVAFALFLRGKVGESLHPQTGVLKAGRREGGGGREGGTDFGKQEYHRKEHLKRSRMV